MAGVRVRHINSHAQPDPNSRGAHVVQEYARQWQRDVHYQHSVTHALTPTPIDVHFKEPWQVYVALYASSVASCLIMLVL